MKEILTDEKFWGKVWNNKKDFSIVKDEFLNNEFKKILNNIITNKDDVQDVIELGASGDGTFLCFLNSYFNKSQLYGLDFDSRSLNMLKEEFSKENVDLNIVTKDILNINVNDKKFDIVSSFGLIEHFKGDTFKTVIENHFKILKKNGYLIVSVPNFESPLYKLQGTLFMPFTLYKKHNLKIINKKYLTMLFAKYGSVMYSDYFGGRYRPPNVIILKKMLNVINKFKFIHNNKKVFYPSILLIIKTGGE